MDGSIKKTSERLDFLATDKTFLHELHLRDIALSDYNSAISYAKDEKAIEIARNMLKKGLSVTDIAEMTGLSEDIISKINSKGDEKI